MTDEEAKSLLRSRLGLDPSRISVIREADELETDSRGRFRRTGRRLDRTPYYNTDDWFFIRFGVGEFRCEMYGSNGVAPCTY